jgi:hypothetical protein
MSFLNARTGSDPVRMLRSTRHALKYHQLLPTGSYCRSCSKSTVTNAVSKPTITKKKYSELPALRPLCETTPNAVLGSEIASNTTRHARHPHVLECVCLYHYSRGLFVNMVVCFSIIQSWNFELALD